MICNGRRRHCRFSFSGRSSSEDVLLDGGTDRVGLFDVDGCGCCKIRTQS
jgi:hypothetical protein